MFWRAAYIIRLGFFFVGARHAVPARPIPAAQPIFLRAARETFGVRLALSEVEGKLARLSASVLSTPFSVHSVLSGLEWRRRMKHRGHGANHRVHRGTATLPNLNRAALENFGVRALGSPSHFRQDLNNPNLSLYCARGGRLRSAGGLSVI